MAPVVVLSSAELRDLGARFFDAMNTRDYAVARDLYAPDAVYESPALPAPGRLAGRDDIIEYFTAVLEDDEFQLVIREQFTGRNLVVTLSTSESRTPQASPGDPR